MVTTGSLSSKPLDLPEEAAEGRGGPVGYPDLRPRMIDATCAQGQVESSEFFLELEEPAGTKGPRKRTHLMTSRRPTARADSPGRVYRRSNRTGRPTWTTSSASALERNRLVAYGATYIGERRLLVPRVMLLTSSPLLRRSSPASRSRRVIRRRGRRR
jgi:hypothetical protein